MRGITRLWHLIAMATTAGTLLLVPCFAQCSCGGQDCISWQLNCSNCGFTFCGPPPEKPTTTPPLDNCKTSVAMTCSVARNADNQPIVCGNANQAAQCYQRNITTSGYKCSDETLATILVRRVVVANSNEAPITDRRPRAMRWYSVRTRPMDANG